MRLRACRSFHEVVLVLAVARLHEALRLVTSSEQVVFRHNLSFALEFLETVKRVNRRMDWIEDGYLKLIDRAKVEGLASVQAERLGLRRESRRMGRKMRHYKRALMRLPWPARFFEGFATL